MTLPASFPLSMSQVAAELGTTLPLSLLDPSVVALAGKSGPPVSMSDLLGKSANGPLVNATMVGANGSGGAIGYANDVNTFGSLAPDLLYGQQVTAIFSQSGSGLTVRVANIASGVGLGQSFFSTIRIDSQTVRNTAAAVYSLSGADYSQWVWTDAGSTANPGNQTVNIS